MPYRDPRDPRRNHIIGNISFHGDPARGSLQERRLRDMPYYTLWEQLQRELRSKVGELTIENIGRAIQQGIGENLVLKLQEIGNQPAEYRRLGMIMPDQVLDAIMRYKNPS